MVEQAAFQGAMKAEKEGPMSAGAGWKMNGSAANGFIVQKQCEEEIRELRVKF